MRILRGAAAVALPLLHGVLLVACATQSTHSSRTSRPASVDRGSKGDAAFAQGSFGVAVTAYEAEVADLESVAEDPTLVLRLALARAAAGRSAADLARARDLLRRLEAAGQLQGEAAALLSLLDDLRMAGAGEASAQHQLELLRSSLQSKDDELLACDEEIASLQGSLEEHEQRVEDLEERLREVEGRARRLAGELEQLKQIDLAAPD